MKKERKKGKIKAWWNDYKKQDENVEKCLRENRKAYAVYIVLLPLIVALYFLLGLFVGRSL